MQTMEKTKLETRHDDRKFVMPKNIVRATIQLAVLKAKKSQLVEYLQKYVRNAKEAEIKIDAVRNRLARIKTPLSEEIIRGRAERT